MDFDPFKNLAVNLKATGPAAILVTWLISVTLLGLFGSGELADRALTILTIFAGVTATALVARS